MNIAEIRQKYPQYNDMTDEQLADALHSKYYSDLPKEQVYEKVGLNTNKEPSYFDLPKSTALGAEQLINRIPESYGSIESPDIAKSMEHYFPSPQTYHKPKVEEIRQGLPHFDVEHLKEKLGRKGHETIADQMIQGLIKHSPELAGIGQLAKGGYKAAVPILKSIYGKVIAPKTELNEISKMADSLAKSMAERKGNILGEETNITKHLKESQEALDARKMQNKQKLEQEFPIKSEEETLENLSVESQKAREDLEAMFNKRYGEYSKEHGSKPIKDTLDFNEFLDKTQNLPGLSKFIKQIQVNPSKKILQYESGAGEVKQIQVPNKAASVDDYINFMRELRDASYVAGRAAKNAPTYGEAQDLYRTKKVLNDFKSEVESKLQSTVGKDAYKDFKDIQSDYEKLTGKMKESRSLTKAAYGDEVSTDIYKKLLQPKNKHLREFLYERPGYAQAMREHMIQGAKHPLSKKAETNVAKQNTFINKILTPAQKEAQKESLKIHGIQEKLNKVSTAIKNPKTLTAAEELEVRNFSPEANKFLDRIAHEDAISKQMVEEGEKLGIKKSELEKEWKKRKWIGGISGTAIGIHLLPDWAKKMLHGLIPK